MPYSTYTNPFEAAGELATRYEDEREDNKDTGLLAGAFESGVYGLGSSFSDALAAGARVLGADRFAEARERSADELAQAAAGAGHMVPKFGEIEGVGDAVGWGQGAIASNLPLLGLMAGAGVLGGVGGAAAMGRRGLARSVGKSAAQEHLEKLARMGIEGEGAQSAAAKIGAAAEADAAKKSYLNLAVQQGLRGQGAGGWLGSRAGVALPYFGATTGETYSGIRHDPDASGTPAEQAKAALLAGAAQTGLGMLIEPVGLAQRAAAMRRAGATISPGTMMGVSALGEGATETGEQAIQQYTQNLFNPQAGYDPMELLEAGLAGTLVGGTYSLPAFVAGSLAGKEPETDTINTQLTEIQKKIDAGQATEEDLVSRDALLASRAVFAVKNADELGMDAPLARNMYEELRERFDEMGGEPQGNLTKRAAFWKRQAMLAAAMTQLRENTPFFQGEEEQRIMEAPYQGTALRHPTYGALVSEAMQLGYNPDVTQDDFAARQEEEIQQYVEKPVQPLVRRILASGGSPVSSNYYGPGDKGVWYIDSNGEDQFAPYQEESASAFTPAQQEQQEPVLVTNLTPEVAATPPNPNEPKPIRDAKEALRALTAQWWDAQHFSARFGLMNEGARSSDFVDLDSEYQNKVTTRFLSMLREKKRQQVEKAAEIGLVGENAIPALEARLKKNQELQIETPMSAKYRLATLWEGKTLEEVSPDLEPQIDSLWETIKKAEGLDTAILAGQVRATNMGLPLGENLTASITKRYVNELFAQEEDFWSGFSSTLEFDGVDQTRNEKRNEELRQLDKRTNLPTSEDLIAEGETLYELLLSAYAEKAQREGVLDTDAERARRSQQLLGAFGGGGARANIAGRASQPAEALPESVEPGRRTLERVVFRPANGPTTLALRDRFTQLEAWIPSRTAIEAGAPITFGGEELSQRSSERFLNRWNTVAAEQGGKVTEDQLLDWAEEFYVAGRPHYSEMADSPTFEIFGPDNNFINLDGEQYVISGVEGDDRVLKIKSNETGDELVLPRSLMSLGRSESMLPATFNGVPIEAQAIAAKLSDAYKKNDKGEPAPVSMDAIMKDARHAYEYRRSEKLGYKVELVLDDSGQMTGMRLAPDVKMGRPNPLMEEYEAIAVVLPSRPELMQQAVRQAVDELATPNPEAGRPEPLVLLGSMDNKLFFATKEQRDRMLNEAGIRDKLNENINLIERIGTLAKKESGDTVRLENLSRIKKRLNRGRGGEINPNDGTVGIIRNIALAQGVLRRALLDKMGNLIRYEYDKGILRSPLQLVQHFVDTTTGRVKTDRNNPIFEEPEALNAKLQFGYTRDDSPGNDQAEFFRMFPPAVQRGGSVNFQQIAFGATNPVALAAMERANFLDKATAETLLGPDAFQRNVEGNIPRNMLMRPETAFGWMSKFSRPTARAYALASADLLNYVGKIDKLDAAKTAELDKQFKEQYHRENGYTPGLDDVLLLPETYNDMNEIFRKDREEKGLPVRNLEQGDVVILHRDPALPDATSMAPFVFRGIASLQYAPGSNDRGVVVHPKSDSWSAAAGDFDGDAGVITLPDENITPQEIRKADEAYSFMKKDDQGNEMKESIDSIIEGNRARWNAMDIDYEVIGEGDYTDKQIRLTSGRTSKSVTRDLVSQLMADRATGFSQMIGSLIRPAQQLAEMGKLDEAYPVQKFDKKGNEIPGQYVQTTFGVLLSKLGQASVSAKKKATWARQAMAIYKQVREEVQERRPIIRNPFTGEQIPAWRQNEEGRWVQEGFRRGNFFISLFANVDRAPLPDSEADRLQRASLIAAAEAEGRTFEPFRVVEAMAPERRQRFSTREWMGYTGTPVNKREHWQVAVQFAERVATAHKLATLRALSAVIGDAAVRGPVEANIKELHGDIVAWDKELKGRTVRETFDNLRDNRNALAAIPSDVLTKMSALYNYAYESGLVTNNDSWVMESPLHVEMAYRALAINRIFDDLNIFSRQSLPREMVEAARDISNSQGILTEEAKYYLQRQVHALNFLARRRNALDPTDEDQKKEMDALSEQSAQINNEIKYLYNLGQFTGADLVAYGPKGFAAREVRIDELQEIASRIQQTHRTGYIKAVDKYKNQIDAKSIVPGIYKLDPDMPGVLIPERLFGQPTDPNFYGVEQRQLQGTGGSDILTGIGPDARVLITNTEAPTQGGSRAVTAKANPTMWDVYKAEQTAGIDASFTTKLGGMNVQFIHDTMNAKNKANRLVRGQKIELPQSRNLAWIQSFRTAKANGKPFYGTIGAGPEKLWFQVLDVSENLVPTAILLGRGTTSEQAFETISWLRMPSEVKQKVKQLGSWLESGPSETSIVKMAEAHGYLNELVALVSLYKDYANLEGGGNWVDINKLLAAQDAYRSAAYTWTWLTHTRPQGGQQQGPQGGPQGPQARPNIAQGSKSKKQMTDDEVLDNLATNINYGRMQNWAESIALLMGVRPPVKVVTAREMYELLSKSSKQEDQDMAKSILEYGRGGVGAEGLHYIRSDGTHFIYVAGGKNKPTRQVGILAHELGHMIIESEWKTLNHTDKKTAEKIHNDWQRYAKKNHMDPDSQELATEWLADQIGAWLVTDQKPKDAAGRWYKQLATTFVKIFRTIKELLTNAVGPNHLPRTMNSVKTWMDSLAKTDEYIKRVYGDGAKGESLVDRINRRQTALKMWAQTGVTDMKALRELVPYVEENLDDLLGQRDANMLRRIAFEPNMRRRLMQLLGRETDIAEQLNDSADKAASYLFALASTGILQPTGEVRNILGDLRRQIQLMNRMLIEATPQELDEMVGNLSLRGGVTREPNRNIFPVDSPAARLYNERRNRAQKGYFGAVERSTQAYKNTFGWYLDDPYMRILRSGIPALVAAAKAIQPAAYEIGGLARSGSLERQRMNYQIFAQRAGEILKKLEPQEKEQLAKIMYNVKNVGQIPQKVSEAKAKLEQLLNDLFTYEQNSGVNIQYRGNYWPMIPNHDMIDANLPGVLDLYTKDEFRPGWQKVARDYMDWLEKEMKAMGLVASPAAVLAEADAQYAAPEIAKERYADMEGYHQRFESVDVAQRSTGDLKNDLKGKKARLAIIERNAPDHQAIPLMLSEIRQIEEELTNRGALDGVEPAGDPLIDTMRREIAQMAGLDPETLEPLPDNPDPRAFVEFYLQNDGARTLPGQALRQAHFDRVHTPSLRFSNPRELDFLVDPNITDDETHRQVVGTMETDPKYILDKYIRAATKRVEHQHLLARLPGGSYSNFIEKAKREGATQDDLRLFSNYVSAVQGMLGLKERDAVDRFVEMFGEGSLINKNFNSNKAGVMNPKLQNANMWVLVWQDISKLSLAFASASADLVGSFAMSQDAKQFYQSIKELRDFLHKRAKELPLNEREKLLDLVGIFEHSMRREDLNSTYAMDKMSGPQQKLLDWFFKINQVERMTDWARGVAGFVSTHAIVAMAETARGTGPEAEQARARLYDLGLTPEDVVLTPTGNLKVLEYEDWRNASPEDKAKDLAIRTAIHRFVDRSTIRPDPTNRALVHSNPYYAIFFQWKGFTTAFNSMIMRPVWAKASEEGDATPLLYLAMTMIPMMLFADTLRDAVKMSLSDDEDEEGDKLLRPAWKKDWDLADHVGYAIERAGFLGNHELAKDVLEPLMQGKVPQALAEMGGPTMGDVRKMANYGYDEFPMPLSDLTGNWG